MQYLGQCFDMKKCGAFHFAQPSFDSLFSFFFALTPLYLYYSTPAVEMAQARRRGAEKLRRTFVYTSEVVAQACGGGVWHVAVSIGYRC